MNKGMKRIYRELILPLKELPKSMENYTFCNRCRAIFKEFDKSLIDSDYSVDLSSLQNDDIRLSLIREVAYFNGRDLFIHFSEKKAREIFHHNSPQLKYHYKYNLTKDIEVEVYRELGWFVSFCIRWRI